MEFRPLAKVGTTAPVDEVVNLLQDALAQARAGKVRSVIVLFEQDDRRGNFGIAWQEASIPTLVAQLQKVNSLLVASMFEEDDPEGGKDPA